MERRVSVNAEATSEGPDWPMDGVPEGRSEGERTELEHIGSEAVPGESESRGQGPCLYLGPAGQRCNRPALAGGFCARHGSGGPRDAIKNPARILAAALGVVALLWPYVSDLVREIIHWAQGH